MSRTTLSDATAATVPEESAKARAPEEAAPAPYVAPAEIGRGGMGRVLRAMDPRLGREVAIKELVASGPNARRRFEREACITARLQHPSIVPIYEIGRRDDGAPFYAMRLVAGRTLADAIRDAPDLPARMTLLRHVGAVADAVAYAHSHRVIHRDLKASNVVLGEFGETVLIDWGLAKDLGAADDDAPDPGPYRGPTGEDLTEAGAVLGTPAYMPPEQAEGEAVDERADVYAIGVMLYHVLTGDMPYRGRTAEAVLLEVIAAPPPPVLARVPEVPRDLAAIVAKAMARARADRYPSARELAAELARWQAGQLVGAHSYSARELTARWLRRHRAVVAVAGIALVAAAVGGALAVQRVIDERDRAERARHEAELARADAVVRADDALLHQARDLVDDDPRAALEALLALSPGSRHWPAARVIASDTAARGVPVVLGELGEAGRSVAVRADGTVIAIGDDAILRAAPGAAAAVTPARAPVLGADGALAWIDADGRRAWIETTGAAARALDLPAGTQRLAIAPGGTALGALAGDQLHLIDAATGADRVFGAIAACQLDTWLGFTEDGGLLVTLCPTSRESRIWQRDGRPFAGPPVRTVYRSPGGRWEVHDREAGTEVVDTRSGTTYPVATFRYPPWIRFVGERWLVAIGHFERDVHVIDLESGAAHGLRGASDVSTIAIASDQATIASGAQDGVVQLWDLRALPRGESPEFGGPSFERPPARVGRGASIAFDPDGTLVTLDLRGQLVRWRHSAHRIELRSGEETSPDLTWQVTLVDGAVLASRVGAAPSTAQRLAGTGPRELRGQLGARAAIGDDGRVVVAAATDGVLRWDPATGAVEPVSTGGPITALALDGDLAVAVTSDQRVMLLPPGAPAREVARAHEPDTWPELLDHGRFVLLHGEQALRLIRVTDGADLAVPDGTHVAFSSDGATLAIGSDALQRCVVATARCEALPDGAHTSVVAISPDGTIAAARDDNEVVLWPAGGGAPRPLGAHGADLTRIAFSADGATLITAGEGIEVRIWDVASGESRLVSGLHAMPVAVRDDGDRVQVADWFATHELPDDAPRDEAALRAWIAGWLAR